MQLEIISDDDTAEGTLIGAEDVIDSIWLEDGDEGPIRITVDPGFPDVPRDVLKEVRETLQRKFAAAEEGVFRQVNLAVSIDRYDPGSRLARYMAPFMAGAARVAISVSGTVNGARVDEETRAARYIGAFGGDSDRMLRSCLQDCLGNIVQGIDTAAGCEPPPFARFWNRVRVARWIVAAVALVAYAAVFAAFRLPNPGKNGPANELFLMILGGLFLAGACLGIVTLGPLLFAPSDFLVNDPQGMKIMTRAGTTSPVLMKIIAAFLLLVSSGGVLLAVALLLEGR